jgi:NADH-quinone oxidoreductase subunit M
MGEWTLFAGALDTAVKDNAATGAVLRYVIFGLGLVATVITMSYMLWMLKRVFFGKLPEHLSHVKEASWYMTAPMMVLAGFTIVVGLYPDLFFKDIIPYMKGVLGA